MELVSVLMPAYNAEKYIRESIESVINQTYSNWELIVVNDGSKDNTQGIVEEYIDQYPKQIRLINIIENGGISDALNKALERANGKYICWLSADDLFLDYALETWANYILKINSDMIFSDYENIDSESKLLKKFHLDKDLNDVICNNSYQPYRAILFCSWLINGCSVMIKKSCFDLVGSFNPRYKYAHDYDMWQRIASMFSVKYLDIVCVRTRVHSEQGTMLGNNDVDSIDVLFDFLQDEVKADSLLEKAGICSSIDGYISIFEKRLILYKHKKREFEKLCDRIDEFLLAYHKKDNLIDEKEKLLLKKIAVIKYNNKIFNDSFFEENKDNNYLELLCNFKGLDGFLINNLGVRFEHFEGNGIQKLNAGFMRSNNIIVCEIEKKRINKIIEQFNGDIKYYITKQKKDVFKIGVSYYMLLDKKYEEIFYGNHMVITEDDIWNSLMEAVITKYEL